MNFLLVLFFLSSSSFAQCLKEPQFNELIEPVLKMECAKFPYELGASLTKLQTIKNVDLYAEDIARMKDATIQIEGSDEKRPITVTLHGDIKLKDQRYFWVGENIDKIDTSQGSL